MMPSSQERLVLAFVDVTGFAKVCRAKADAEVFAALDAHYRHVADAVAPCGGRVVKAMGDGLLLVFPAGRAKEAVACLRGLRFSAAPPWVRFHPSCTVRFHAHLARVAAGPLGPEGRFDIVGREVNTLFLMPWDGRELSAELARQVGE